MTQVFNLSGPALDWAVAKCEFEGCEDWDGTLDGVDCVSDMQGEVYAPSTVWLQGGPIIEREGIELTRCNDLYFPTGNEKGDHYEPYWEAKIDLNEGDVMVEKQYGPTPLIAAMRCYVASKLGESINLPEELQ